MDQPTYREYYVSRAATSRDLARRTLDPMIAGIHAQFAVRYDALVAQTMPSDARDLPAIQTA